MAITQYENDPKLWLISTFENMTQKTCPFWDLELRIMFWKGQDKYDTTLFTLEEVNLLHGKRDLVMQALQERIST